MRLKHGAPVPGGELSAAGVSRWLTHPGAEEKGGKRMAQVTSDRRAEMQKLVAELRSLEQSPLYGQREEKGYTPVMGEGDLEADIMFIGEAPGRKEAESGRPFVGRAGQSLDTLLDSIGIDRGDVYITNVVKDRPPENRKPRVEEIRAYADLLLREIEIIEPEVIVTLGGVAATFVLEEFDHPQRGQAIGELHGEILVAEAPHGTVAVLPLYHPAAVCYDRSLAETLERDFRVLKQFA